MVFSSELFVYGFMPIFFALYFLISDQNRNWLILAGSLVFYGIGAGSTVLVLLASIWVNQYLALRMEGAPAARRRALLTAGVVLNLLGLGYYKYGSFLWQLTGATVAFAGLGQLPTAPSIPLPIGISFFTFQAISYLVDVYRGEISAAASYGEFATYHSLFPQLVAGPIVRYREIKSEMLKRRIDRSALTEGAYRFCLGLGKKMIIADNVGTVVDATFALPMAELDPLRAWIGIFCYALQIYFDFSGYSDMAIGLGRLLGFHFPENFNQPYRSASITEFWRRWHMTLSRWFRDYVYSPLGGNRSGRTRTLVNLWMVFFLCGLWHGAGLTFIVWGLYHGLLLVLERIADSQWRWRPSGAAGTAVSFVLVMIGWVFFRSPTLVEAGNYLTAMAGLGPRTGGVAPIHSYLSSDTLFFVAMGTLFAFAPLDALSRLRFDRPGLMTSQLGLSTLCFAYSALLLAANSFNPFIYFRF